MSDGSSTRNSGTEASGRSINEIRPIDPDFFCIDRHLTQWFSSMALLCLNCA
jgi:hypothetical protein